MASKKQLRAEIEWLKNARAAALTRATTAERQLLEAFDREHMLKRIIEQREEVIGALQVDIPATKRIGLSEHNNCEHVWQFTGESVQGEFNQTFHVLKCVNCPSTKEDLCVC